MRRRTLVALFLVWCAAGCGNQGAPQSSGAPASADLVYGSCAFCHNSLAVHMTATGGHGTLSLKCEACHQDLTPGEVGCGHRSVPRCPDCHRTQITHHDPAVAAPQQCTLCHTPHGSSNLLLIRPEVPLTNASNMTTDCTTDGDCEPGEVCASDDPVCGSAARTGGCAAPIIFTNLAGRADGSFASVSRPGTGICEVCHTSTEFYTSNGMGEPHFTQACYPCHPHARSFVPQ